MIIYMYSEHGRFSVNYNIWHVIFTESLQIQLSWLLHTKDLSTSSSSNDFQSIAYNAVNIML